MSEKIRCYDCHTLSVPYETKIGNLQDCKCELCNGTYRIKVYPGKRLVILGKVDRDSDLLKKS